MKIKDIISMALLLFVSYYLTQSKIDKRNRVDKISNVLNEIPNLLKQLLELSSVCQDNDDFRKNNFMILKKISNKIGMLNKAKKSILNEELYNYIYFEFNEINNMVSEHLDGSKDASNIEKIANIRCSLERHVNNIESKCDEAYIEINF